MASCLPQSGWEGTWKGGERVVLQSPPGRGPARHNLATHETSSPSNPGLSISLGLGTLMIPGNNEKCLLNSRSYIYIYIQTHTHTHTRTTVPQKRQESGSPPLARCPGISTWVKGIFLRHSQEMTAAKVATKYCSSVFSPDGPSVRVLIPEVRGHTGLLWIHTALWSWEPRPLSTWSAGEPRWARLDRGEWYLPLCHFPHHHPTASDSL